jgi:hypothetical protein
LYAGTGKTLLARACAAQTKACYLKLAGPSLVQMFIGDGAKLVRDAFELAKEKAPAIIFIDELDAIGTKRFDSEKSGDREVQRTMLELLNQLDGFSSDERIKVRHARPSILCTHSGHSTLRRSHVGHRGDEPHRHPRPRAPALWPSGPEDRVPAAERDGALADPRDPQPEDEREQGREL